MATEKHDRTQGAVEDPSSAETLPARTVWAFDRILTTSGVYPPNHVRFLEPVGVLQDLLEERHGLSLAMDVGLTTISVHNQLADLGEPGVERLLALCRTLGLIRIEFLPGLGPDDLHRFALILLQLRSRAGESHLFHQIDLTEIPATIQITPTRLIR